MLWLTACLEAQGHDAYVARFKVRSTHIMFPSLQVWSASHMFFEPVQACH